MEKMSFDKITVKDIVDDCDVSRNTFYYNYRDIFAVIEDLFEKESSEIVQNTGGDQSWQSALFEICSFLQKYKSAVFSMYGSSRRDFLVGLIRKLIRAMINSAVDSASAGFKLSPEDRALIADFYCGAVEGFVLRWLDNRMKDDVFSVISRAEKVFDGDVAAAVRAASGDFSTL